MSAKRKKTTADTAASFFSDGKRIEIVGRGGQVMRVGRRDARRLAQVCLHADPRWELLPSDWRDYLTTKKKP